MPCEHFQDALTEAAATTAGPQGDLRAHLETCAPCRATFAAEQSLFYSIDMALQAAANAEVPPTLLPRVRARLNEENLPTRGWLNARFALAAAATLAIAFLMTQIHWRSDRTRPPVNTVANKVPLPSQTSPVQKQNLIPGLTTKKHSLANPQLAVSQNRALRKLPPTRNPEPEVLVPRDQEILLASYQQHWQSRKRALFASGNSLVASLTSLEIAPIQIAELDVKLMAEEQQP